jgi:hypothetical protein
MPKRLPASAELFPPEASQPGLFDDMPVPGEFVLPADAQQGRCASCGAAIAWIHTDGGKAMPLSLRTRRTIGDVEYATTHFSDCPHSRQWSKR